MPFGLCNVPTTFQRCMISIFSDYVEKGIEVFMDDFTIYGDSFISSNGIVVDKAKTDIIRSLPYPTTVREIHSLLGHAGFYRRESFDELKEKLVSAPIVQLPNWDYPFELMCDASDTSVGVVLGQNIGKEPHVIAYASQGPPFQEEFTEENMMLAQSRTPWFADLVNYLATGKLKSKWEGPFVVTQIYPHGAVEIEDNKGN
ncbi:hypothetical protein V6N12_050204 [Hibiscus sabdariffa]|uniref:Reverse transcriptase/retrotransposon-derived protein RNase H-like domain-containing protein n=1 Tax=Hibiscus sabdariffa TaxID=183260 RepID=A0ABR2GBV3_9ROSI